MAEYWTDIFSYLAGAVRTNGMVYLALVGDDEAEQKIPSSGDTHDEVAGPDVAPASQTAMKSQTSISSQNWNDLNR